MDGGSHLESQRAVGDNQLLPVHSLCEAAGFSQQWDGFIEEKMAGRSQVASPNQTTMTG
jgi:hypothetical protein